MHCTPRNMKTRNAMGAQVVRLKSDDPNVPKTFVVPPGDRGDYVQHKLALRLRQPETAVSTLWLLSKDGAVLREMNYRKKPVNDATYRVVVGLQKTHELRMTYGSWTDKQGGASYAVRHARSVQ